MNLKINACGLHDCTADWCWHTPEAGISGYNLWAVFRGKGTLTCGEKAFPLREGVVMLLPPGTPFSADTDPTRLLWIITVHFTVSDEEDNPIHPFPLRAKLIEDPTFFRTLLNRTITNFNRNQTDTAALFLQTVLADFDASCDLEHSDVNSEWLHIVREIAGEIDFIKDIPTLEDYARRYGYSRRYIGKMFYSVMGISFSDYTRNARIGKAKALLKHTDTSINEIAEITGFCDACHFAKTFKAAVGMSPLAYRKNQ